MKRTLLFILAVCGYFSPHAQVRLFHQTVSPQDLPATQQLQQNEFRHYLGTRYVKQSLVLAEQDYLISINDQLSVLSRFRQMHRYPAGSYAYEGVIEGAEPGHVVLSAYADRIAGMITLDDGRRFIVDQTADGIFAISQSAEAAFVAQEKTDDFIEIKASADQINAQANADVCNVNNTCPSASVIDLMVVYTPQAEGLWGGQANTVANITTAVTNMTTSMTNSGVNNVSFRLAHAAKVTYTESGSTSTDLSRLAGTADGFMDEVHTLRNQYGADMVSLIVGSPTNTCGVGYLNSSPTNYSAGSGFNVSVYNCVVGNYTMAHEFGHNMGLHHDYYVSSSTTPCAHHHGYVNQNAIALGTSSTPAQRWRTIMAYNDHCSVVGGFSCTRLNRWSNPQLTYNGDPTGRAIGTTNPADEAYGFYRFACVVAGFRPEASACPTPGNPVTTNITTNSATLSWTAVAGALSYDVEYKTSSASTWTPAATGTTATSVNLAGLAAATAYNWRVHTNCAGPTVSNDATASFTTNALCGTPAGLATTNITATTATLGWNGVSGATSYAVDIKLSSVSTWTPVTAATTNTSVSVSDLVSGTAYNWRVRATCPAGTGADATASFTTTVVACTDPYEANNTRAAATAITPGANIQALIGASNDNDYFKFSNSSATPNLRVTLSNLPANYNLELYRNGVSKRVAVSANSGNTSETITLNNAAIGLYEIRVFGASRSTFNALQCYTLNATVSSTAFDQADNDKADWEVVEAGAVKVYPVPAKGTLNIAFDAPENGRTEISLINQLGVSVQQKTMAASKGTNFTTMNVSTTPSGMYILKLVQGQTLRTVKVVVVQ